MKFLRLTRKQKILRNCAVVAVCLFLLAWMMEFPCLTKEGLLKRVERKYLLDEPTELLYEGRTMYGNGKVLYARNGEQLLHVSYSSALVGMQLGTTKLYPEADYLLTVSYWYTGVSSYATYSAQIVGFLEKVEAAELELTVKSMGERYSKILLQGRRQSPYCFTFQSSEMDNINAGILYAELVGGGAAMLRLYGKDGEVLQERTFDRLTTVNEGGRLP